MHPPMPGQKYLVRCWVGGDSKNPTVEIPLELGAPAADAELTQTLDLPVPFNRLRVTKYLAAAELIQEVVAAEGEGGAPAAQIAIEGPTQSYRRWLAAGDAERNRLVSYIATWRYVTAGAAAERDELFRQFSEEFTRVPVLTVARADGSGAHAFAFAADQVEEVPGLECKVRMLRFLPHFSRSEETKEPVNRSQRRVNPAALVEFEYQGRQEQRWVFGKFPGYERPSAGAVPVAVSLDCPQEAERPVPDLVLVSKAGGEHEVWIRHEGRCESRPIAVNEVVPIPKTQYGFRLTSLVPKGRLVERYAPAASGRGVAAIQFSVGAAEGSSSEQWVELNKFRVVEQGGERLTVSLAIPTMETVGGHP